MANQSVVRDERGCAMEVREGGGFIIHGNDISNVEVTAERHWLTIGNDPYENSVMLNIESIDHLIEALTSIRDSLPTAN